MLSLRSFSYRLIDWAWWFPEWFLTWWLSLTLSCCLAGHDPFCRHRFVYGHDISPPYAWACEHAERRVHEVRLPVRGAWRDESWNNWRFVHDRGQGRRWASKASCGGVCCLEVFCSVLCILNAWWIYLWSASLPFRTWLWHEAIQSIARSLHVTPSGVPLRTVIAFKVTCKMTGLSWDVQWRLSAFIGLSLKAPERVSSSHARCSSWACRGTFSRLLAFHWTLRRTFVLFNRYGLWRRQVQEKSFTRSHARTGRGWLETAVNITSVQVFGSCVHGQCHIILGRQMAYVLHTLTVCYFLAFVCILIAHYILLKSF